MKIIFFGSGKFAVKILETLHGGGFKVWLVVTQPDRKKGRHLRVGRTPVKEYALNNKLEIFQPEDINSPEAIDELKHKEADIFLVVSYGRILSENILKLPKLLPVNIHASLLPKYRGAAPINRALMKGEKITGITFIKMNELMDEGDIIFQKSLRIEPSDDAVSLDDKLSTLASESLAEVIGLIGKKGFEPKKQDSNEATYAPLMKKTDGLILWKDTSKQIIGNFRGCYGWPGSYTYYKNKILKVLSMEEAEYSQDAAPGQILEAKDNRLVVACGKGCIAIHEVLPESHKKMEVKSFLAGHDVKISEKLG